MPSNADIITPVLLAEMIAESEGHPSRIAYIDSMRKCWKHYNANSQWLSPDADIAIIDSNMSDDYPVSFENRIKKVINDTVSIMLMNRPIVHHYPHSGRPQDIELADNMDEMLASAWEADGANIGSVVYSGLLEAKISGMGVIKITWDPFNKRRGDEGEILAIKVPSSDIFFDPYASNDHRGRDCRYIIHRLWQTPEAIIGKYGKKGKIALNLESITEEDQPKAKVGRIWSRFAGLTTENLRSGMTGGGGSDAHEKVDRRIPVYECWLAPIEGYDDESLANNTVDGVDASYGMLVTMINNIIVRKIPNPNIEEKTVSNIDEEIGTFSMQTVKLGSGSNPFVIFYHQPICDNEGKNGIYDCSGIVEQIISSQMSYNAVGTNIEINARVTANPSMDVVEDAIMDLPPDRIVNEPGTIYRINPKYAGMIEGVKRMSQPGQMPAFVYTFWKDKKEAMSELAGLHPEMTGMAPEGTSHLPAQALAGIQTAAFTPLRTPVQELDYAIYDISVLVDGLMQQKYKEGRFIAVSNKGLRKYIKWQEAHIMANFIRKVVSSSTTPIADVDKVNRLQLIKAEVDNALASQNPFIIKSTIITLNNLNDPYAYDWIQLLQEALEELMSMQQGMENLGYADIAGQATQTEQPQGYDEGFSSFASELGVSPEQLEAALNE